MHEHCVFYVCCNESCFVIICWHTTLFSFVCAKSNLCILVYWICGKVMCCCYGANLLKRKEEKDGTMNKGNSDIVKLFVAAMAQMFYKRNTCFDRYLLFYTQILHQA